MAVSVVKENKRIPAKLHKYVKGCAIKEGYVDWKDFLKGCFVVNKNPHPKDPYAVKRF